jgi:hypothetical protein
MAELVTKTDIQTLTTHVDARLDNLVAGISCSP